MKHAVVWLTVVLIVCLLTVPMSSYANSILTVLAFVTDDDGVPVDGLEVTVSNVSKDLVQSGYTGEASRGAYITVFMDFTTSVVDVDDEILVTVNEDGQTVAEATRMVTASQLDQSPTVVVVPVRYVDEASFPRWDVNQDGVVNIFDLVLVGGQYGQRGEGLLGDVNDDGVVDLQDLEIIGEHFGEKSVAAAPAVHLRTDRATRHTLDADAVGRIQTALIDLDYGKAGDRAYLVGRLLQQWLAGVTDMSPQTRMHPNYPNPFNPETWLPYQLAADATVQVSIYNTSGQLVRHIDVGHRAAGAYLTQDRAVYWDGRSEQGEQVASGVYYVRFQADSFRQTRKVVVAK